MLHVTCYMIHDTSIHPSLVKELELWLVDTGRRQQSWWLTWLVFICNNPNDSIRSLPSSFHSLDRAWWCIVRMYSSEPITWFFILILADMVWGRRRNIDRNRAGLCGMIKPSVWFFYVGGDWCECVSVWVCDWLTGWLADWLINN